jgi:hypothetical protein
MSENKIELAYRAELNDYAREMPILRKKIKALQKALQPFAAVADALEFYVEEAHPSEDELVFPDMDTKIMHGECGRKQISHEDFFKARAALIESKK